MRGISPRTLILFLSILCAPAVSHAQIQAEPYTPDSCLALPSNLAHAEAVAGVCEFAASLPQKMPSFICDQDAARYQGNNIVPFDLVTASVRYEDGREHYDRIKVNGSPVSDTMFQLTGLWSTGEFGSDLRAIFDPRNQARFEFMRESKWKGHAAWVFNYRIAHQNEPLWRLNSETQTVAPPYKGTLWIDQKSGELLRFGAVAIDLPKTFSMSVAEFQIDYADVAFGDATSFVLPAEFTAISALRNQPSTTNVVRFRGCRKFRAKSRMVLNVPSAVRDAGTESAKTPESVEREREQNEQIYAILREQAVREDAARLEFESQVRVNLATSAALRFLAALEKRREENAAAVAASEPEPASPASAATRDLTTLKVDVRLVPVPVVLRDSKGIAIGNLRKEDFQLFDNGKPQAITGFSVEASGAVAEPGSDAAKNPDGAGAAYATRTKPAGAARDVAYVFDDIHSDVGDLAQARDAAGRHIAALSAGDRAAVFSTSGEIGTAFTTNREKLVQALLGLRQHPALHGTQCPPMSEYEADLIVNRNDVDTLDTAARDALACAYAGMATKSDMARAEQLAKSAAIDVINASSAANQNTLNVLYEVLRRTAAMPGARSIVLVSSGFLSLTPATRQSVTELVDRAVRANIIVHTLDLRGLYTPGLSPNLSHPTNPVLRSGLDREEALARSDVLAELAHGTGGTFFHNNNDVNEGFRRTADAPEYLYVLGFSPQKLDGKFHKLTVKLVGAQKLAVQSRQGYYAAKSPQ